MDEQQSEVLDEALPVTRNTLYSPVHIAAATYFGSFIGGFLLLALNYHRLNYPIRAKVAIVAPLIVTLVMVCLLQLPFIDFHVTRISDHVISLLHCVCMFLFANFLQGKQYASEIEKGSVEGPLWAACGLGILVQLVVLALVAVVYLLSLQFEEC